MKRTRSLLWGVAVLLGVGGTAVAGQHQIPTVGINTVQRWAYGGLGAARNSADIYQLIGCIVYSDTTGSSTTCYAQDATGKTYVSCYTFDANLRAAVQSLKGDSFLEFNWDASGQCTNIQVENQSALEPKR